MFSVSPFGRLGTPITKLLKSISGTPSSCGATGKIPGAPPAPEANPRSESFTFVPPCGWLNLVYSRKYPRRNSFTADELNVLVSPRLMLSVWPKRFTVNAAAEFVVRQVRRFLAVCVCAGSQRADGPWRSRQNVLQQVLRDWIEAGRRQLRGRENTGGCARTPGRVVRLAGNNTLPKLRTQLRRPCRAIHSRGVTFVVNELRR